MSNTYQDKGMAFTHGVRVQGVPSDKDVAMRMTVYTVTYKTANGDESVATFIDDDGIDAGERAYAFAAAATRISGVMWVLVSEHVETWNHWSFINDL